MWASAGVFVSLFATEGKHPGGMSIIIIINPGTTVIGKCKYRKAENSRHPPLPPFRSRTGKQVWVLRENTRGKFYWKD